MRNIVNISLPEKLNKMVKRAVKTGRYSTKSEFFRDLLRMWAEGNLLHELNESRKELTAGKGRVLRSLRDLR